MSLETMLYHDCRDPPLVKAAYDTTWHLSRVHVRTESIVLRTESQEQFLDLKEEYDIEDDLGPVSLTRAVSNETSLANAAAAGDETSVRKFLAAGVDLNTPPARIRGRNALQAACGNGNLRIVDILLEAGASVNAPPSEWYGRSPLAAAAARGQVEVVRRLIEAGANVNARAAEQYGRTAVQSAAEAGNEEVLEVLLNAGANPDEPACPFGGRTALAAAAGSGHEGVCRILLAAGADPDAPASASRGVMALHAAASGGLSKIVHLLLLAGADVNAANTSDLRTALHTAAQYGQTIVARLLHRHGAQPGLRDVNGRQPIHVASQYGRLEFVKWLLSLRPQMDIDGQDYNGATPLHLASEYEPAAVQALLEAGADTEIADHRNYRPLHVAFETGSTESIRHLLRGGVETIDFPVGKWRDVLKAQPEEVIVFTEVSSQFKKVGRTAVTGAVRGLDDWDSAVRKYYSTYAVKSPSVQDFVINPRSYMPHSKTINNRLRPASKAERATIDWLWSPIIPDPAFLPRLGQWATIGRVHGYTVYSKPITSQTTNGNAAIALIPGLPNLSNIAVSPRKVVLVCHVSFDMLFPASENDIFEEEDGFHEHSNKNSVLENDLLDEAVEQQETDEEDIETDIFGTRIEKCQISWIMVGPRSSKDFETGPSQQGAGIGEKTDGILQSLEYRSAMSDCGWIPRHGVEFITFFILDLHKKWKKLFQAAEEHLAETRERLLLNKGKSRDLIEHLLKDAQKWADFRVLLQLHIGKANSLVEEYKCHSFLYEEVLFCEDEDDASKRTALETLSEVISALGNDAQASISRLDEKTKEMIGLEFSLVSIHEAQRSTIMTVSMKRLSWITFIFLPMMFVSSIFGMNVNALNGDPDWRWYLVFSTAVMLIVTFVWLLFKYIKLEAWLEAKVDGFMEIIFTVLSRRIERRRRQRKRGNGRRVFDEEEGLQEPNIAIVPLSPVSSEHKAPEWWINRSNKAKNT